MDSDYENSNEYQLWKTLPFQDVSERGKTYFDLSLIAFTKGQFRKSLVLAESASDCFSQKSDEVSLANCLTAIAFSQYELKQRSEAIKTLSESVALFEKTFNDQEWEYRNYLARWLKEESQLNQAKNQLEKCLDYYLYEGDDLSAMRAFELLGEILCEIGNCKEAIKNFEAARNLQRDRHEPFWVAETDICISRCYNHLKNGVDAQAFASKAIAVLDSTKNKTKQADAYGQLGRALINRGEFNQALDVLEKAHALVSGVNQIDFQAIYGIQANKVRALRALDRQGEADIIERCNELINETLQWSKD